jgi:nitrogenase molybdenum-iron protein alpha/beta subunit
VIVTRRRDPGNRQGHLWDAAGYNYAANVTDLPGSAADLVACYDKRADMEKAIHELKEDFGIDRISCSSFGANAADLELKILALSISSCSISARPSAGRSCTGPRPSGDGSSRWPPS